MKRIASIFFVFILLVLGRTTVHGQVPNVIFDSDMSSDWDDVGDIAVLHGLASVGECKIIGMAVSSQNGGTALCMDAINTYFGKPDIPIGVRPDVGGIGLYAGQIQSEYPHGPETTPQDFPLAVNMYRKALAASADKSVVIASTGYLNNLQALLQSGADQYSPLNGIDLVKQKVKLWACAGGAFPSGGEFNFGVEPAAAYYVVNHWPTAVTYTPFDLGHEIFTCGRLPVLSLDNPIRRVYVDIKNGYPYPSWGQIAIYQAIRGSGNLWGGVNVGSNVCNPDGTNYWVSSPDPDGPDDQMYLSGKARTPVRDGIDALIMLSPNDGRASKPGEPTDLRATIVNGSQINLQWTDNAFNETGFVVEQRQNGVYSQIAMVAANVTSYSVTGLTSTVNQSFRIKSRNATGDSARYAYVWIYSGWTETNIQNTTQLPLYTYYQTCDLRSAVDGGPNHLSVNNDSMHGQNMTLDVDTLALASQGNLYVYFFYQNQNNWYRLNSGTSTSQFEKCVNGTISQIGATAANLADGGPSLRPWRLEVASTGTLKFIDEGVTILNVTDTLSFSSGKIALGGYGRTPVWENFRFDAAPNGAPPETPPLPPTGLVSVPGDAKVALSWNAMYGATSYTVKQGLNSQGPFTNLATVTIPSYTHAGLTNGTKYFYVITASDAAGEGQISKVVQGSPYAAGGGPGGSTVVGTPGSFGNNDNTIQKVFDGNLATFFDAPTASGAWAGLDYVTPRVFAQVQYAPRAGQSGRMVDGLIQGANNADFSDAVVLYSVNAAPTEGVMTVQTITNSTAFRYVRYLSSPNGWCNIAELTFALAGSGTGSAPAAPTGLGATAGNAQISLSWSASSGATSYNVYRGTAAGDESATPAATNVTGTTYSDTGLANGTAYFYKVRAVNADGASTDSNEASATPTAGSSAPAAPTNLAAAAGSAQVSLSWSASSGVTSYNVYRGTSAGGESATAIATGVTGTTYTNTGLTNGTAYFYKVAAVNGAGTSSYSNEASATPTAGGGGGSGAAFANAGFETPSFGGYSYAPAGSSWTFTNNGGIQHNGSAYSGTTTLAPEGTQTALLQGVSGTLGTMSQSVGFGASGTYTIGFQAARRYGAAQPVRVSINGAAVGTYTPASNNFEQMTTAQFSISAPGNYTVLFAATDSSGDKTTFLDAVSIASTGTAPATPTGLNATAVNAQVNLSWMASSGATTYNVYRGTSADGESTTPVATGITGTSYTNTGLTNGVAYYYKLAAVNSYGTSAYSNEAAATPLSAYQQWKVERGLAYNSDDTAAPDGDGIAVLMKYATGMTLGVAGVSPATLAPFSGGRALRFNRLNPTTVDYSVEVSSNLLTWITIATLPAGSTAWNGTASVSESGAGSPMTTTVLDNTSPAAGVPRFLRLRVTVP